MKFYTSPGGHRFLAPKRVFVRWAHFPYGKWVCTDGREILFNRFYEPVWQRRAGEPPTPADPCEWVKGEKQQSWFYSDADKTEKAMRAKAEKALAVWLAEATVPA